MKWLLSAALVVVLMVVPVSASTITWGSATLSDDNGGVFLSGSSVSSAGAIWSLFLPNYSSSGAVDPSLVPNFVGLGLSASISGGFITGVTFTYIGSFSGSGYAAFSQTANAGSGSGTFSSSYSEFLSLASATTLNLTTELRLFDQFDSAAVNEVRFELQTQEATVPEPATLTLLASAFIALAGLTYYRRCRA